MSKKRIDLAFFNIGAIIGAGLGVVLALAVLTSAQGALVRNDLKFALIFPIAGYFAGSFMWDCAFPPKKR